MDLSNPLATITPTLDAGVLQVLASTTNPVTAATVHRRLGRGSDEGVRKVLARLVRQGIVLMDTPARYPLYVVNRQHVVYPQIEALTLVRQRIVDNIVGEISSWEIAPTHASLFGSFARGEADSDSDIDVLVVRPEEVDADAERTWLDQVDQLDRRITAWTGNVAQILDVSPQTVGRLSRDEDPLVVGWRADSRTLFGEPVMDVLRRFR